MHNLLKYNSFFLYHFFIYSRFLHLFLCLELCSLKLFHKQAHAEIHIEDILLCKATRSTGDIRRRDGRNISS